MTIIYEGGCPQCGRTGPGDNDQTVCRKCAKKKPEIPPIEIVNEDPQSDNKNCQVGVLFAWGIIVGALICYFFRLIL